MEVDKGKKYLLRIANASLNDKLFFAAAMYRLILYTPSPLQPPLYQLLQDETQMFLLMPTGFQLGTSWQSLNNPIILNVVKICKLKTEKAISWIFIHI